MKLGQIMKWMGQHQKVLAGGVGLIVAVFTGLAAPIVIQDYQTQGFGSAVVSGLFALALILSVLFNAGFLQNIIRRMELLDRRHRLRIEFVAARQHGARDAVHRRARAFLDKADLSDGGCEIYGVISYLEAIGSDGEETNAIKEYYAKIEQLVKSGASYVRIVQLPIDLAKAPYAQWSQQIKLHYRNHFDNVLAMRQSDELQQGGNLLQAVSRFPLSFVLIRNNNSDSYYLIWQLDEQRENEQQGQSQFRLHGIFLIEDPDRSIVDHFIKCVNELRNSGWPVSNEVQDI